MDVEKKQIWYEYICLQCGWAYNELEGDLKNGFPPKTKWEDLPDNYKCHECEIVKSDKEMWEKNEVFEK
jgi:rubredoxin